MTGSTDPGDNGFEETFDENDRQSFSAHNVIWEKDPLKALALANQKVHKNADLAIVATGSIFMIREILRKV